MTRSVLAVTLDILEQAEAVRAVMPDIAARLESDADALLMGLGVMSVSEVSSELRVSRQTVYAWLEQGLLARADSDAQTLVPVRSVVAIRPAIDRWEAAGRRGRPSRYVREWQQGAVALRDYATRQGRLRAQGTEPDDTTPLLGEPISDGSVAAAPPQRDAQRRVEELQIERRDHNTALHAPARAHRRDQANRLAAAGHTHHPSGHSPRVDLS